jgi:hypothetical protein
LRTQPVLDRAATNHRDRFVVRYPKQPRTQRRVPTATLQRLEGTRESRLNCILRVGLITQDRATKPIQRLVIALVQDGKRPRAPLRHMARESLVATDNNPAE